MEDPDLLKQKLEFLQLELDDAKAKEAQLINMYESMIKSLTLESANDRQKGNIKENALEELNKVKAEYGAQVQAIKKRYKEKLKTLQQDYEGLQEKNTELEFSLKDIKIKSEEKINGLFQEAQNLTLQKRELEDKIKEYIENPDRKLSERFQKEIENLKKEIETIKEEHEHELLRAREQENKNVQDFKEIYELDKAFLENQIKKLQQELAEEKEKSDKKINESYETSLDQSIDISILDSSEKIDDLEHIKLEVGRSIEKWKNDLDSLVTNVREKVLESTTFSMIKQIDKAEQMKSFAEDTQEEILKLNSQLSFFHKLVRAFETHQNKLKEQLDGLKEENDKLKRTIRLKVSEDKSLSYQDTIEQLSDQLLMKETEISRLKRAIGELRCELDYANTKPPITPNKNKHNRALTMLAKAEFSPPQLIPCKENGNENSFCDHRLVEKLQRILNFAYTIECKNCRSNMSPLIFVSHIENCKENNSIDYDHVDYKYELKLAREKIDELENKISHLYIEVGKLKNFKDKAYIENEKLIIGYKEIKLKLAVQREKSAQGENVLIAEIKNLFDVLTNVRSNIVLPKNIYTEIETAINKSARFFGGKIALKYKPYQS